VTVMPKRGRPKIDPGPRPPAGLSPLQYMLAVMNDPAVPDRTRDLMARKAIKFCHPRLAGRDKAETKSPRRHVTPVMEPRRWEDQD
jgi:hypothetical protein